MTFTPQDHTEREEMWGLFKDGVLVGRWCHNKPGMVWSANLPDFPDMQVPLFGDRELLNGKSPTKVDDKGSWKLAPGYEIKPVRAPATT